MRREDPRRHSTGMSAPVSPPRVAWGDQFKGRLTFAKTGIGKQTGLPSMVKILIQMSVFTLLPFCMYGWGQMVMPR